MSVSLCLFRSWKKLLTFNFINVMTNLSNKMVMISTGYVDINGVRMFAKIHMCGALRHLAVDIMCHKHESHSYTCPVKNYRVTKIGNAIRIYAFDAVSRLDANHDINQVVDGIISDVNLKVFVESIKF